MNEKRGIIYYCDGISSHFQELKHSIKSVRTIHPEIPITVFTNNPKLPFIGSVRKEVLQTQLHPMLAKVLAMKNSPYVHSLFLDCDTEVKHPLDNLFSHLDRSDKKIWIAHEAKLQHTFPPKLISRLDPDDLNTGILLFDQSLETSNFLAYWALEVSKVPREKADKLEIQDQIVFNQLFKRNKRDIQLIIGKLDNELYNVRRWLFSEMTPLQQERVIIRHWHMMHRSRLSIKIESLYYFVLRKVFGIMIYQRG